jgi:hypothetical protein
MSLLGILQDSSYVGKHTKKDSIKYIKIQQGSFIY